IETSPADERAIHAADGEELADVLCRHAPSVEDWYALARLLAPQRRDPRSNVPVRLAGLWGGGGMPGPNRPDRLVRDHDRRALTLVDARQSFRQLSGQHRLSLIAGALVPCLADAENGPQSVAQRGPHLFPRVGVGLAEKAASFRMADDHVAAAQIFEHQRRDFPGVRAGVFPVHVLRGQFYGRGPWPAG